MISPCADCHPLAPSKLSETDYHRSLELLEHREDLTEEQRQRAREWLDKQYQPKEK